MEKFQFAKLIGFITGKGAKIEYADIVYIGNTIDECAPKVETIDENLWVRRSAVSNTVDTLMRGMRDNKKIEAIKACRELTGLGLKEAKDMVEFVMHRQIT